MYSVVMRAEATAFASAGPAASVPMSMLGIQVMEGWRVLRVSVEMLSRIANRLL